MIGLINIKRVSKSTLDRDYLISGDHPRLGFSDIKFIQHAFIEHQAGVNLNLFILVLLYIMLQHITQGIEVFSTCLTLVCFNVEHMLIVHMLLKCKLFFTFKAKMITVQNLFVVIVVFNCFLGFAIFFFRA